MKTRNIGIIVSIIGLVMMVYTGFTYVTTKKVVDLGPIQVTKEQEHPIQWSPVIGGILLVAGLVVIITNKNGK
jgi:hypothetical protein